MVDLLHSMSVALGYRHAKADINSDAYYPSGYSDADLDQLRSRKLLLEVLEGKRQIPMLAQVYQGAERTETEPSKTESGSPPEPKS